MALGQTLTNKRDNSNKSFQKSSHSLVDIRNTSLYHEANSKEDNDAHPIFEAGFTCYLGI